MPTEKTNLRDRISRILVKNNLRTDQVAINELLKLTTISWEELALRLGPVWKLIGYTSTVDEGSDLSMCWRLRAAELSKEAETSLRGIIHE